ncbi:hypothetical protein D3C81_2169660 [compost metagenome]
MPHSFEPLKKGMRTSKQLRIPQRYYGFILRSARYRCSALLQTIFYTLLYRFRSQALF